MTVTLSKNPVTVLATRLADDIESHGHYQGIRTPAHVRKEGAACIIANHTFESSWSPGAPDLMNALGERLGFTPRPSLSDPIHYNLGYIMNWNDETPTAEVLDTLRSL